MLPVTTRCRRPLALALVVLVAAAASAQAPRPDFYITNGVVTATALSADGATLYVGGGFTSVGPNTGQGVRLSPTSSAVLPGGAFVNGTINASVADGSGGYYIGGTFTSVGGVARNRVAHILADGTLDAAFDPNVNSEVNALVLDGTTLYAGGSFSAVNGTTTRNSLAAFSTATGAATAFDPNVNSTVRALVLGGGTLYAGGSFMTVNGTTARNRLAAFSTATGAATAFNPNVNNIVVALALDGTTLYAGGDFTTVNGTATTRNRLAAFSLATGTATAFDPNVNNRASSLALDGGTLYAGGFFTTVNGTTTTRNRLAAFSTATGAATAFNPNVNNIVIALALDGTTLYAGGTFSAVNGTATRNSLAAFSTATGAATAFDPNVGRGVFALALGGGTLFAGGGFTTVGGTTRNNLAAFSTATGAVTAFDPNVNNLIVALALDSGTLYAGGSFSAVNGTTTRNNLAAFSTATGTATAFDPNVNALVRALALDGGTLYAGGDFTTVNGTTTRNRLAALSTATGAVTAFDPNMNNIVVTLALGGGTLYAGGVFTAVNGTTTRNNLAAFSTATGTATAFDPNVNTLVNALALDGTTLYAGGFFTTVNGTATTRNRLAAFSLATGTATAFDPNVNGNVEALALDGTTLYAGGLFTTVNGTTTRNSLAAFSTATGTATAFDPNMSNTVRALAVGGGALYAGGSFQAAGGRSGPNLAAFAVPALVAQGSGLFNPSAAPGDGAGYRLLGAPVTGYTVNDLAALNLVQGVAAGANAAAFPAQYPTAGYNVLPTYTGGGPTLAAFPQPAGTDVVLASGRGFFWYLYDLAIPASGGFGGGTSTSHELTGFTLAATGTSPATTVAVAFADNAGDNFQMLANPFGRPLATAGITASGGALSGGVVQAYGLTPTGPTFVTLGLTGDATPDVLAVWQGAFAELVPTAAGAAVTVTYDFSQTQPGTTPPFYGKDTAVAASEAAPPTVFLALAGTLASGTPVADAAAAVRFLPDALAGWDALDASKLTPLAQDYALVAPGITRDGAPYRLAVDSRPLGAAAVPVAFTTTAAGTFTLSWTLAGRDSTSALPEGWAATLTDTATGRTVDLSQAPSYAFTADAAAGWAERFVLAVSPRGATASEPAAVARPTVSRPAPNPAAGRSALTVSVPVPERVRATVFDALGREVLVLLDGEVTGAVTLGVPTSRLAPGVYTVRVVGATFAETRRLTVVR